MNEKEFLINKIITRLRSMDLTTVKAFHTVATRLSSMPDTGERNYVINRETKKTDHHKG